LRVVFGTNIHGSAFVLPGSQADIALRRIVDGTDELVISKAIIDELLSVLARKFSRDADELAHVAVFISDLAMLVRPQRRVEVLQDKADNRILECASAGKADVVVTGDRAMLDLGSFGGIRMVSLKQYLDQG